MARINLLPWREKLRKQQQTEFGVVMAIGVIITGLIMAAVHFYHVDRTEYQQKRIAYIKNSISILDKQIAQIKKIEQTRENLRKRIEKVRDLERNRAEIVHLFDELSKNLPEGVHLTGVVQRKKNVYIKGVANDNNDISQYITALEKSPWLDKLDLAIVRHKEKDASRKIRIGEFEVTAVQRSPKDESQK